MAGPYGSVRGVKDLLGASNHTLPVEQTSRVVTALSAVSLLIEHRTGCVFGDSTPETRLEEDGNGTLLYLGRGIRTISSIVEGPAWSGSAWQGGVALAPAQYRPTSRTVTTGVYRTITRMDGAWSGSYAITGVWEDRVPDVPDDVAYFANYLTAELWKRQMMSPAASFGPDGATLPLRDVLREPEVKLFFDKWSIGPQVMVV